MGFASFVARVRAERKCNLPLGLFVCYHKVMIKSSSDNTTPRWKRSAVKGTLIGVRLQPSQLKALDAWIDNASLIRPEAIRAMLDAVLVVVAKDPGEKRTGNASNKTRAAELAAKVVDKMID